MLEALKSHWREYLTEACGLVGFMVGASLLTTLLEHPDSPVQHMMGQQPLLRRVPLGIIMGAYIAATVYSPWGKRSGAHVNPAVTVSFLWLGKIKPWDALFYLFAQFAGAILAAQAMALALGKLYSHPSIHYATTIPGAGANATARAFTAEFIISFILMFVVLVAINSEHLERFAGLFAGLLIGIYFIVEAPYSGMSLNPARSFGSALAARHWLDLWVYFTAPPLGMLLAAEAYRWLRKGQQIACARLHQRNARRCIFCDHKAAPNYPNETAD